MSHPKCSSQGLVLTTRSNVSFIIQDIWNISIIIAKIDWVRREAARNGDFFNYWASFATSDIEHFHVELRSLLDYVALIASQIANKSGQIPTTFRRLQQWTKESAGNEKRLGTDLARLVSSANWAPDIRLVRDSILHLGANTLVLPKPTDRILFQVYGKAWREYIDNELVMDSGNVVDFGLYCAWYTSKLIVFVEELSKVIRTRLGVDTVALDAKSYSPGFGVLKDWIVKLLEKMESD